MVENNGLDRVFELATSNKTYAKSLNLHEIKNENLLGCRSDFELNGSMNTTGIEHKTNISFRKTDVFESYTIAIDTDYDSRDITFTGYVCR